MNKKLKIISCIILAFVLIIPVGFIFIPTTSAASSVIKPDIEDAFNNSFDDGMTDSSWYNYTGNYSVYEDFEDFETGWGRYQETGNGGRTDTEAYVIDGDWSVYNLDDRSDDIYTEINTTGYKMMRAEFYFRFNSSSGFGYDEVWEVFLDNGTSNSVKQYNIDDENYTDDVIYHDVIWVDFSDYGNPDTFNFGWQGVSGWGSFDCWYLDNVSLSFIEDTDYLTYFDNDSLAVVGDGYANFELNSSYIDNQPFSLDYKLLLIDGDVTIDYLNESGDVIYSLIHSIYHDASKYVESMDMNDDGKIDFLDIQAFVDVYGQTGSPGWIKQDYVTDGVINYNDISAYGNDYEPSEICQVKLNYSYLSVIEPFSMNITEIDVFDGIDNLAEYLNWDVNDDGTVDSDDTYLLNHSYYSYYEYIAYMYETNPDSDVLYEYTHSQISDDRTDWLHLYHQFNHDFYTDDNYSAIKRYSDIAVSLTTDNSIYQDWEYVALQAMYGNVTEINITGDSDTIAYFDDFIVCPTPYDLELTSFTPASDEVNVSTTISPSLNFTLLNNSFTPFVANSDFIYDASITGEGTSEMTGTTVELITSNTPVTAGPLYLSFSEDVDWYVNVSLEKWGSWEMPDDGLGTSHYTFSTEEYSPPTAVLTSPLHDAEVQPEAETDIVFTPNSDYDAGVGTELYLWDGADWDYQGYLSFISTTLSNWTLYLGTDYSPGDTIYWRMRLSDSYSDTLGYGYFPNSTQSSLFRGGYRCYNFTVLPNTAPYFVSSYPDNASDYNPVSDTIQVNFSNNGTYEHGYISLDVWANFTINTTDGGYINESIWIVEDNRLIRDGIISYDEDDSWYDYIDDGNLSLNFTLTPEQLWYALHRHAYVNDTNITLCMRLSDLDNVIWKNLTFTINLLLGQDLPEMVIHYPVYDSELPNAYWGNEHDLSFTLSDTEGDPIYGYFTVYLVQDDMDVQISRITPLNPNIETMYDDVDYTDDDWDDIDDPYFYQNGTYSLDLSWYVPFLDEEYKIVFTIYDYLGGDVIRYIGNSYVLRFTVGNPPGTDYKLSLRDFYADDGKVQTWAAFNVRYDGFTGGNIGANSIATFLVDEEHHIKRVDTAILGIGDGSGVHPWRLLRYSSVPDDSYDYYIGFCDVRPVLTSPQLPNLILFISDGYTYSIQEPYNDDVFTRCRFHKPINVLGESMIYRDAGSGVGVYSFMGATTAADTTTPSTAQAGDIPTFIFTLENLGIGGLELIIALFIIVAFMFIPYLIIRDKADSVPMPVIASFGFVGVLFSMMLNLIPLYVIIIPFIGLLFFLVYRIANFIWGNVRKTGGDSGVM